jgi:hypothetical protein
LSLKIAKSSILTQIDELANLSNLSDLRELQSSDLHQKMDTMASTLTDAIFDASNASIPRSTVTTKSKPWWNENLRNLRRNLTSLNRKATKNPYYHRDYQAAKNRYYNAIKRAKIDHWNQFLTKEDPASIFKAMSYTKDIMAQPIPGITDISTNTLKTDFSDKCDAFRAALFPNPPTAPEVDLSDYTANPS